ncbi:MAG: hypothetical protein OXC54_11765 [Rhodospirillaceae bacterium]|nr:hypothetical protein [Rhodospirillaceae bacterium]
MTRKAAYDAVERVFAAMASEDGLAVRIDFPGRPRVYQPPKRAIRLQGRV